MKKKITKRINPLLIYWEKLMKVKVKRAMIKKKMKISKKKKLNQ